MHRGGEDKHRDVAFDGELVVGRQIRVIGMGDRGCVELQHEPPASDDDAPDRFQIGAQSLEAVLDQILERRRRYPRQRPRFLLLSRWTAVET